MMDFDMETTMRINNLARELLKGGAASSSADAHMKAEKIIMAESGMKKSDIETAQARSQQPATSQGTADRTASMQTTQSLPRSEFDKLTNYDERILRDLSMMKAKLDELQRSVNALSGLSKEIDGLKSYITMSLRQERAVSQPAPAQQSVSQQAPTPQAAQPNSGQATVPEAEKKSMHPRCGGYSSNDVAIDKIFYSGSK